ncbi:MAG: hypothetical protein AAFQ94_20935 [Bacteroidota bacterium]
MGFSSEAIFIKPELSKEEQLTLLNNLGYSDYIDNGETYFEEADSRQKHGVYIGHINGATYVIYDGVYETGNRNKDQLTDTEQKIVDTFPNSEILSLINIESVNAYGNSYIKAGTPIRVKEGAHPHVITNYGEELLIEKDYYVKKEHIDGNEFFYTKNHYQEGELNKWTHDQIGGSVAFELTKMIAGVSYTHDDIFYSEPHQFIPKNELQNVLSALENGKGEIPDKYVGFIPKKDFNELIDSVKEQLDSLNFKMDDQFNFKKEQNNLIYNITFTPFKDNEHIVRPQLNYKIEARRKEWYEEKFNRDKNRLGNSINNNIQVDAHSIGISDDRRDIFRFQGDYSYEKLSNEILIKIEKVILPYFEKVNGLEFIAEQNQSIFRIDFYLMAENYEKAEEAIIATLKKLAPVSVKESWTQEKLNNVLLEFEDKSGLLSNKIDVREIFESAVTVDEDDKQGEPSLQESIPPETEELQQQKSQLKKPWWKFW